MADLPLWQPRSGGIPAVATEADLPAAGDPPLMVIAMRDSTALDGNGNALPALYLWSVATAAWVRGGLAGGGSVDSDYIVVTAELTGIHNGMSIGWDAGAGRFEPAGVG